MLPELSKIFSEISREDFLKPWARARVLAHIPHKREPLPVYGFSLGSQDPRAPVFFLCGGIHGIERIGAQSVWSLLKSSIDRLYWDESFKNILNKIRLSFVPLANPTGYVDLRRSNFRGVDLMRNSPVAASDPVPWMIGGHRYSNRWPWYRGNPQEPEVEITSIENFFMMECEHSRQVISLDFHSGFGFRDRLWFPHAHTKKLFVHLPELYGLIELLEETHPYHVYMIEPQSQAYLIHGDLWDHLFFCLKKKNPESLYIPLTLEMGSWNWVKKNPAQLFNILGVFNPIKDHRVKRTFRRHIFLYDFLCRALYSAESWANPKDSQKTRAQEQALVRWYA